MANINLIDTHAHLDFEVFAQTIDQVLEASKSVGVSKIIVPGVTLKDTDRVIALIEKYDNLYGAVGLHPSDAKDWNDKSYQILKEYSANPKIVAIGETGLDYYWDKTFIDLQKTVFVEHIKLAKEINKPLIIHNRDAHADTLALLKETKANEVGGVMHCFSGSADFAMECVKFGFYIAIGGPVTFKNAHKPKEVVRKIPLERLLLETDSPFLTPHPFRGQQNDPSKVRLVAEEIAHLREISIEELSEITTNNVKALFGI